MIPRPSHLRRVRTLLRRYPVVAIIGARQVGKTTLARTVMEEWPGATSIFDLEDPVESARLGEPSLVLRRLQGLVVIDEVQRLPEVFPLLRVLADRPRRPARFLVLGSASPGLLRQTSESLAGRIAYHELGGFTLDEVGIDRLDQLWLRGGFPLSFLAPTEDASEEWRRQFVKTFLERDVPELGIGIPSTTLRRFWSMLAHWHGQIWNASEFGRTFGVSDTTVRKYLDTLTATLVVRQLLPWTENLAKRQVRSPKIYVADPGILHTFLGIKDFRDLEGHPKLGASWEGFLLDAVIRRLGARSEECFFWATHAGAELDLLVVRGRHRRGFEFKRTDAPKVTPSMRTALVDLRLDSLDVIHAGPETFPLAPRIRAVAAGRILQDLKPLRT